MVRIKDLTALTSLATNDEFAVEDTSANQTKKITWANIATLITFTPLSLTGVGSTSWFAASFTPVLTGITIGDGTLDCYYWQFGSIVFYTFWFEWGSTTAATGDFSFTLPVASGTMLDENTRVGDVSVTDVSATPDDIYAGSVYWGTGSDGVLKIKQVSGANILELNMTGTLPITIAVGDRITAQGFYRV